MIVEVVVPSAGIEVGEAETVEDDALTAPATSVSVPKLVDPLVTPLIVEFPDSEPFVILPEASGLVAVGRTFIPEYVILHLSLPLLALVTVTVIVDVVGVTVSLDESLTCVELGLLHDPTAPTVAVTEFVVVSNSNPEGTFKIIVPVPISPFVSSEITGPVKGVCDPPAVSAGIAPPPVAAVTVAVA